MKHLASFTLFASIYLVIGCRPAEEPVEEVCFEREILPIVISHCTDGSGCHHPNSGKDLTTYDGIMSYVEPGNFKESKLYRIMASGDDLIRKTGNAYIQIPTGEQYNKVALWISQGAEYGACNDQSLCNKPEISFKRDIQPVLNDYCTGCHNPYTAVASRLDLKGYSAFNNAVGNVEDPDSTIIIKSLKGTPGTKKMPIYGTDLPECTINAIKIWIKNGKPNN